MRVYEKSDKYAKGKSGVRRTQFVEAAKGTNLFFAVYETEVKDKKTGEIGKKRIYNTIALNDAIQRLKAGLSVAPPNEEGNAPIFVLSPNDLVYVPTEDEIKNRQLKYPLDNNRIYKMVSSTGTECFFIQESVAKSIIDKFEFSSLNKMEKAITGEMIKETCVPVTFDRLGNLIKK